MHDELHATMNAFGLHDTQPRRLVLQAMHTEGKPMDQKAIHEWIKTVGAAINLTTVYRVLEKFEKVGLIHRLPATGGYVLCTEKCSGNGHIGFMCCRKCGNVDEFEEAELTHAEDRVANRAGFLIEKHTNELVGLCASCQSN